MGVFIIEVFTGIEAADTALRSRGTNGSWADHGPRPERR
jgi:hypothetical protein